MIVASSPSGEHEANTALRRSVREPAPEKRSLASILRDHGPLTVADAVDVALDVCDELANAHVNGIVHGDLGLHRVRTQWPRVPGQRVDIFALEENDSGAFAFRAAAVGTLVSPEQRDGRIVDARADVWAVGAMLHWMIAGVPPTQQPIERTLTNVPSTLVIAIAGCLSEDPSKRPQSVDELAEILGSFASSPPERFEQLARRRTLVENAKRVRSDLGDVDRVLGRLDDAAIARELTVGTPGADPATDRLMSAVHRTTGSVIFDPPLRVTEHADEAPISSQATKPAAVPAAPESVHSVLPLVTTPAVLASALLAPPKPEVAEAAAAVSVVAPRREHRMKPWMLALAGIGAASLALGVSIGIGIVEHLTVTPAPAKTPPVVETAAVASTTAPTPAPTQATPAAPVEPASASVLAPGSLPDARPATPASLPDAKPAVHRARPSAMTRPKAPASTVVTEGTTETDNVPKGFKSFDPDSAQW